MLKDFGKTDTVSLNNMFLSAFRAKKNDRAIELGNQLMALGFADPNLYGTMARIYQEKGEGAKGLALIQDARKKYPGNTNFITEELNYYLQAGDNQNAVRVLDEAIAAFKDDNEMLKALYFNSGVIFGQLGDKAKSKEYYLKAIEADPNYYGALNNFAGFLLEEANEIIKQANNLPLNKVKEFDELKAKANEKYKEAASYLERAYEIQQNAKMKTTLLEIFTRLQDEEKMAKYK
jgi:tetratricopeptide (TPR) repeat protein